MDYTVPERLKHGDEVRVIAPAVSLAVVSEENCRLAVKRLEDLGLRVSFGRHVNECDEFSSSGVKARLEDLHEAFSNRAVKGILTALGGYNSNQLLSGIDYELIGKNPKIFCGYSDVTSLQNAILAQTGLVSYSGPHFSTFAMKIGFEYTLEHFTAMMFVGGMERVLPSKSWSSDGEWYKDQEKRSFEVNEGPQVICEGEAEGTIVGGHLGTLLLLKGTKYMPSLDGSILFLEDTEGGERDVYFDRNLQALVDLPEFSGVRGVVIGRFEKSTNIDLARLEAIIRNKPALLNMPVVYGLDFGHSSPIFTFPIGGKARVLARKGASLELWV